MAHRKASPLHHGTHSLGHRGGRRIVYVDETLAFPTQVGGCARKAKHARAGFAAYRQPRGQRCAFHAGAWVCEYSFGVPPGQPCPKVTVRVMFKLPCGLISGPNFFREHKSIFDFGPSNGFKSKPSDSCVPFTDELVGGQGSALIYRFYMLTASARDDGPDRSTPTRIPPVAWPPSVESLVFEDGTTLKWDVGLAAERPTREAGGCERPQDGMIPGFVSRIEEGDVLGPMPQVLQSWIVLPVRTLLREKDDILGVV